MKKKKKTKRFRKPHRRKIKKPFYKKKFFVYSVIAFLLIVFIFSFFAFFDLFSIKKIEIKGNEEIESEKLINFIDKKTIKSFLFLESKSIFFFIPKKIAPEIVNEFPGLAGFKLTRKYPDTIKLEVKERKPIGVWCQDDCFLIDSFGKIYKKTNIKRGIIIKTEDRLFEIGNKVFDKEEIQSLMLIWQNLNPNIGINEFEILGSKVSVLTEENWNIYFTFEKDINFQLTKLYLTLKENIPLKNRKNINYIDLRFEKRIYFKYKDENLVNIVDEN